MKVGFILDGNFKNDQRVINEARILEHAKYEVFVLNLPIKNDTNFLKFSPKISLIKNRIPRRILNYLFALDNLLPLYDFFWYLAIIKFVKKYSLNVLHVHDLYLSRPAGWVVRKLNIPLVIDLHENYPAAINGYRWATQFPARWIVRPWRWRKKEKKYLSFASAIIVLSSHYKKILCEKYPEINPDTIAIYPNVPDIKTLLSYPVDKNILPLTGKIIIFYFGIISRRRGIHTIINALQSMLPEHPQLHLLLIGPVDKAEAKDFQKAFLRKELQNNITHYSWRDISEFPSFAEYSHICISPILKNNQHESGVANKIFQYMLFGKPVVASDCTPQKEIIDRTGCGLIFKNGDPVDLASKLSILIQDREKRLKMGELGKKAVLEEYNTEFQGYSLIKMYADLSK